MHSKNNFGKFSGYLSATDLPAGKVIKNAILMDNTLRKKCRREVVRRLDRALVYTSSNNTRIVVPKGFITDGASVPPVFWSLVPPYGLHGRAAVLHDWLYATGYKPGRDIADYLFLEAMISCGVPAWRWKIMYAAVRCFGEKYYYDAASYINRVHE